MKKIFAIALALVMVLSMASAFAMTCGTIDWACATTYNCGKGSVEVIPYVKGNGCGTGNTWTVSTCAGAINNDDVYFAVKVVVDENANDEWWADASLTIESKGLNNFSAVVADVDDLVKATNSDRELKAGEYYLVRDGASFKLVKAADFNADDAASLYVAKVTDAAKAKVCAKLTSKVTAVGKYVDVADYKIAWRSGKVIDVWNGKTGADSKQALFTINGSDKIENVTFKVGAAEYTLTDFGFLKADGSVTGYCAPFDWLKAVMDYFKLDFRNTCFTEKAFKANFGWDDSIESCFSWSSDVVSVVNTDCVVAIPKTGDVSVVAYAVMAVVAAAGTMLKK